MRGLKVCKIDVKSREENDLSDMIGTHLLERKR